MSHALAKTVGSYSAGTRVRVMNYTKARTAFVQVECASKEVLEVQLDEIVQLRFRSGVVPSENSKQRRRNKKALANATEIT